MTAPFIVFEGGEGTGKSTQARLLARALEEFDIAVVTTREPGGTPGAEAIRELLLHPPGEGWSTSAEALLFAGARADHVAKVVRPAITANQWVLCDRFVDSSRAYQGLASRLGDAAIKTLHDIGSESLQPDLTIVLTLDDDVRNRRLALRDGQAADAIGGRDETFHRSVADAFRQFAEGRDDYVVIDSASPEAVVHAQVLKEVQARFGAP